MSDDPLRGSNLPPVPPTASPAVPLGGKHAGLVAPGGTPIPPVPTLTELHHLIQRVGRDVILLAIGLAVVALVALVALGAGWVALDTRSYASDLDARITASDTERARVDGLLQHSQCETLRAMRSTYSTAGREAYPGGSGAFDEFYSELAKAASPLNCVGG